ncbi:hypothetical protein LP7551_03880 [Roseibium album]|nr:hypothetical protein LP7551_03880 [Roseibium album]
MRIMKKVTTTLAVIGFSAMGARADVPETAICGVEQAVACPAYEACERTLPSAVNLPALMKIDRAAGVILSKRESGETRTSKIASEMEGDGVHILHGAEDGRPWSIRIDLETGRFTLASAHDDLGFVAFGICSSGLMSAGEGEQ